MTKIIAIVLAITVVILSGCTWGQEAIPTIRENPTEYRYVVFLKNPAPGGSTVLLEWNAYNSETKQEEIQFEYYHLEYDTKEIVFEVDPFEKDNFTQMSFYIISEFYDVGMYQGDLTIRFYENDVRILELFINNWKGQEIQDFKNIPW